MARLAVLLQRAGLPIAVHEETSCSGRELVVCSRRAALMARPRHVSQTSLQPSGALQLRTCRTSVAPRAHAESSGVKALALSIDELQTVLQLANSTAATPQELNEAATVLVQLVGSASAARQLVVRQPALLTCMLPAWVQFLTGIGLSKSQVQHVLCQAPEALVKTDLVAAGTSIVTFRRLGMSEYETAQLVAYYPQLLGKDEADIRKTLDILGRYQQGIDTNGAF